MHIMTIEDRLTALENRVAKLEKPRKTSVSSKQAKAAQTLLKLFGDRKEMKASEAHHAIPSGVNPFYVRKAASIRCELRDGWYWWIRD